MLGAVMKKTLFLLITFFLLSCTENGGVHYEAFFFNQSGVNVLLIWNDIDNEIPDTIKIVPGDTSTAIKENRFPLLQENGLRWNEKSTLYNIQLVFYVKPDSLKCLLYIGSEFLVNDIRNINSYENIGECDVRGNYISEAMLYRITEDMLNEAVPCD
jgi:hypothetical protein